MQFSHLHCHTQFSLLDGASSIKNMAKKAKENNMPAVAITDHGNMFGVFSFVAECNKLNIKPIVGCEFYIVEDRHKKTFTKENGDKRYHQLMLAKDQAGYINLSKLCSLGFIEGYYSKYPRIDKELIEKYHKGLIATTCCLGALVPQLILNNSIEAAEEEFKWWLNIFGEDYYIEIQRHGLPEQEKVNSVLLQFAKKYNVKTIATNDSHYIDNKDAYAHEILLCINTGAKMTTPAGDGKHDRFAFPNSEFYFKTTEEMVALYTDIPEAIDNTNEIVSKITTPNLKRDILLPNFPIPAPFKSEKEYLTHLTYEGAKKRYKIITLEIEERLQYELKVINDMGFEGYFLIVSDFIRAGKDMDVMVGPGRGSAAGSVVAYCIEITNIDPIAYNLLFERFLNPERVSMPDIDTDFDEQGRVKVIDYVIEKYGKNKVAQIITYGTMGAKSAIKDVARALDLPLADSNALSKFVPERAGISLEEAFKESKDLDAIRKGTDLRAKILEQALVLEGSVRNTGIHAAGVIIAPDDITNYIPVALAKDSNLWITQYEGKIIEETGMLKMDFLGLTNLNYIKDALAMIKKHRNIILDIDQIPLDDESTFKLFQQGETTAIFQFESDGMKKHLKDLKPTNIEDLIAMNALYRPGPLQFIPNFINRKHGKEKIEYPHELLETLLASTYGIMVYQEQIMETARIIAGYSLGGADLLRRAMGKKDKEKMAKERIKFVDGAATLHGIAEKKANDIFDLMERFAEYGFNRSHAAAYSVLAYQTAYLKANFSADYMAAVMSKKTDDIKGITFLSNECKRMGIAVLGPDINESDEIFAVNKEGNLRFALSGIKGLGDAAVDSIITERNNNGAYLDYIDFIKRINLRTVNKKSIEVLAAAGALDNFNNGHRAQYFAFVKDNTTFIEHTIKWASSLQDSKAAAVASLFGGINDAKNIKLPEFPLAEPWPLLKQLQSEKEVIGFYLSGHPLDTFALDIELFTNCTIEEIEQKEDVELKIAGIVTKVDKRLDKKGNTYARFEIEDFSGQKEFVVFNEDYIKYNQYLIEGTMLYVKGVYRRKFKSDFFEFKISNINLLSTVRELESRFLVISLNLENLTPQFIDSLHQTLNEHPGRCNFKIKLNYATENINLSFNALTYKIEPSNELIASLKQLEISGVSINDL
jgi:DNA polymerase-3 subunit alpha